MPKITEVELGKFMALLERGYSQEAAARIIGRERSSLARALARYKKRNTLAHIGGNGRPPVITDAMGATIEAQRAKKTRTSLRKLADLASETHGVPVSYKTVREWLNDRNLFAYSCVPKPLLTPVHVAKRMNRAELWLALTKDEIKTIIFSDESRFDVEYGDGKAFSWHAPGESLEPGNIQPTVKFGGGSVMVWGCFSYYGRGELIFIEGTVDAVSYINILTDALPASIRQMGLSTFLFQQDNAPAHTANVTKAFFERRGIKLLPWPPQSPDMNPIENLWAIMKQRVGKMGAKTKEELRENIMKVWNELPYELFQKLALSFKKRVTALYRAQGHHINY